MASQVKSVPVKRIIISLPDELLEKLNQLAQRKGLTRAAYIRMVLTGEVQEEERRQE